jgi:TatD DNase family protein
MSLHDTHFHLDLFETPEEVVRKIEAAKIYTIAVTNSPSVFFYTKKITSTSKYIRPALGLHPELVSERYKEVDQLIELLDETRYIGEVGLDNSGKIVKDYDIQKKAFERIIRACSDKGDKILTIHSRRAAKDAISMIGKNFKGKIILHWYSDGIKELERALDFGFYFSVNYSMTKSANGQKIIQALPTNRILIETDGPFILYGNKPADPLMVEVIVDQICKIKGMNGDNISSHNIHSNFKKLISE